MFEMSEGLIKVLVLLPSFLFSLCVHEYSHAWVAVRRGDLTPLKLGRLTLHPMAHADLMGTLLLPAVCIYFGFPFFGWAKPVPVDYRNFRGGRRDMALVAFAGPASNIMMAFISTVLLGGLARLTSGNPVSETLALFLLTSMQVNLMLAIFNLLPFPPLDGYQILAGFAPPTWRGFLFAIESRAGIILLILLLTGSLSTLSVPVQWTFRWLLTLVG